MFCFIAKTSVLCYHKRIELQRSTHLKKKELCFILSLLLCAVLLLIARPYFGSTSSQIQITVNGEVLGIYSLAEDQTIQIQDNVCTIKDGKARMTQASCPDQLCIRQGAIDLHGGMIVCLPNKIVIEATQTKSDPGIDAIVG